MSAPLFVTPCCQPIIIPGPPGKPGSVVVGVNGLNAFGKLSIPFTMPAVSASATATMDTAAWASVGLPVFVGFLGFMQVAGVISTTQLSLTNLGYANNAAAGTVAPTSSVVTPAGIQGTSQIMTGVGNPNGSVAGNKGAVYIQIPGDGSASIWLKTTDGGVTGWV